MGVWQPVTTLRDYISQNPPAVTFFLCLLTLAFSFICLSSYSYTHTLPNPDTTTDWNHVLSSLSQFQLCVKANANSLDLVSPVPSSLATGDNAVNSTKTPVTTLSLKVPVTVTAVSSGDPLSDLHLHTSLKAKQLNLGGDQIINVTLEVLSGNESYTCLTITAPAHLLPERLLPPGCPTTEKNIDPIYVEASDKPGTASDTCYSLDPKNDPTLTVMLTQEEQGVAVRHLMEVSVLLLTVCLILCLISSVTHSLMRRYHWNGLDLQNEPLMDS